MNTTQKIIYTIWPFVAAGIAKAVFKDEQPFTFFTGLFCFVSFLIYAKFLLPYIENKYDVIAQIDTKDALERKKNDGTVYIAWFHLLITVGLIFLFFKNL
ncbi:MAG: hypothetical protein EOO43_10570 [Flavobacterium sp.]|nr:MAG: hypothetical protein EOO43_10570 [Flavobacterium sp.]